MQRVCPHRVGARGLNYAVLQDQQAHRHHQREHNHGNADPRRVDRLGVFQSVKRLKGNQHRTHANKQRLRHARQRFRLAVPIAVIVIGRTQRVMHRQQVEERGHAIEQRVCQPGEHADRTTEPPGDGFGDDQNTGHRHRGAGGQA